MKQLAAVATLALLVLSCASGNGASNATGVPAPDIRFVQLVGPEQQNWPSGEFEVKYGVRIGNHANEQITLRHIELTPFTSEGAYTVVQQRYNFQEKIGAQATHDVIFWAKAWAAERARYNINAQSPITIRGIAFFDSASGSFRKPFMAQLSQAGGRGRQ